MKRHEANEFLRGYIDTALFTTDPNPPGGCDYVASGRAEELWPSLPDWFIDKAKADCARFTTLHADLLAKAGSDEQNGADFWYTRNGHGVGFWDRDYDEEIGDALSSASEAFGEVYLMPEDFGLESNE